MAPQCAPTEWVGRAGRWAELLHLHTDEGQGQTTWTHTTHFLAPSPDDNGYNGAVRVVFALSPLGLGFQWAVFLGPVILA